MTTRRNLVIFVSVTICLLIGVNTALCSDYINYRLLPGSTFTPKYMATITGPTEALTGTFQWHYEYHFREVQGEVFKVTELNFESDSYTFTLKAETPASFLIKDTTNAAIFYTAVNVTGRPITEGMVSGGGTYSGSPLSPTYLSYPSIDLYPIGGGSYYGSLTLYAEQIPEPATLLFLGLGALALRRKR